ncbi:ABC-type Fe3+ transporter permease [Corynebacterium glutamicum]|uniref:ABC transporter permease n=1 Tax=Corynebacterium glutamicum TaxID=1718 RepID=UPI00097BA0AB|nr:iron ABC transporter permease [Corynebacterium glutamicum]GAV98042.1 ABC-type Fe3+ transporter permease [Corynebacterium glutamicum]
MNDSNKNIKALFQSPMFVLILVIVGWFIATFLILPNLVLLLEVFRPDKEWSFGVWSKLLSSERAMNSLRNSFILAFVLIFTVNVVGVFIVLVTRYFDIVGARFLYLAFATSLVYGGVVMASGYKLIYGPNGFLTNVALRIYPDLDPNWFTGMFAVIVVSTIAGTGNHLLFMSSAMQKVDHQTVEAAKQMGASMWTILRQIVLPVLKPTIFSITVLTFLGGLGAMAVPLVLGGSEFQTISPMILSFSNSLTSRDLAAALAMILGLATMIMLFVLNRLERGGTYFSVSKVSVELPKQKIENPVVNIVVHVVAYVLAVIYAVPPVLIIVFSFTNAATISTGKLSLSSFTLENYISIFTEKAAFEPFLISIVYSAVASVVVVVAMLFVARIIQRFPSALTNWIEYLLHLPWILPATMIALGLVLTFGQQRSLVGGFVLTGTLIILAIGYVIEKIPFTLRMLKASFMGISSSMEEAASILGASQMQTFGRVLMPLVIPAASAITALNFNSLLDNYDTAVFLAHPFYQPLGIFIQNATTQDTINDTTALTFVYTVLLMIISTVTLYLVYGRNANTSKPAKKQNRRTFNLIKRG